MSSCLDISTKVLQKSGKRRVKAARLQAVNTPGDANFPTISGDGYGEARCVLHHLLFTKNHPSLRLTLSACDRWAIFGEPVLQGKNDYCDDDLMLH